MPNQTSNKIEDYFEIAVGINCLNLVDIDISEAPPIATIMLQGYESSVERIIKPMISDIRNEIEKFLTGEMSWASYEQKKSRQALVTGMTMK